MRSRLHCVALPRRVLLATGQRDPRERELRLGYLDPRCSESSDCVQRTGGRDIERSQACSGDCSAWNRRIAALTRRGGRPYGPARTHRGACRCLSRACSPRGSLGGLPRRPAPRRFAFSCMQTRCAQPRAARPLFSDDAYCGDRGPELGPAGTRSSCGATLLGSCWPLARRLENIRGFPYVHYGFAGRLFLAAPC